MFLKNKVENDIANHMLKFQENRYCDIAWNENFLYTPLVNLPVFSDKP